MPYQTIKNKGAVQADRAWIREHLGFITDRHQICVAITRAKHGLVIVGEYNLPLQHIFGFLIEKIYNCHGIMRSNNKLKITKMLPHN